MDIPVTPGHPFGGKFQMPFVLQVLLANHQTEADPQVRDYVGGIRYPLGMLGDGRAPCA